MEPVTLVLKDARTISGPLVTYDGSLVILVEYERSKCCCLVLNWAAAPLLSPLLRYTVTTKLSQCTSVGRCAVCEVTTVDACVCTISAPGRLSLREVAKILNHGFLPLAVLNAKALKHMYSTLLQSTAHEFLTMLGVRDLLLPFSSVDGAVTAMSRVQGKISAFPSVLREYATQLSASALYGYLVNPRAKNKVSRHLTLANLIAEFRGSRHPLATQCTGATLYSSVIPLLPILGITPRAFLVPITSDRNRDLVRDLVAFNPRDPAERLAADSRDLVAIGGLRGIIALWESMREESRPMHSTTVIDNAIMHIALDAWCSKALRERIYTYSTSTRATWRGFAHFLWALVDPAAVRTYCNTDDHTKYDVNGSAMITATTTLRDFTLFVHARLDSADCYDSIRNGEVHPWLAELIGHPTSPVEASQAPTSPLRLPETHGWTVAKYPLALGLDDQSARYNRMFTLHYSQRTAGKEAHIAQAVSALAMDAPDSCAVTLYGAEDMNDADATAHLLRLADAHLFSFVIVTPRRATHRRRVLVDALTAEFGDAIPAKTAVLATNQVSRMRKGRGARIFVDSAHLLETDEAYALICALGRALVAQRLVHVHFLGCAQLPSPGVGDAFGLIARNWCGVDDKIISGDDVGMALLAKWTVGQHWHAYSLTTAISNALSGPDALRMNSESAMAHGAATPLWLSVPDDGRALLRCFVTQGKRELVYVVSRYALHQGRKRKHDELPGVYITACALGVHGDPRTRVVAIDATTLEHLTRLEWNSLLRYAHRVVAMHDTARAHTPMHLQQLYLKQSAYRGRHTSQST